MYTLNYVGSTLTCMEGILFQSFWYLFCPAVTVQGCRSWCGKISPSLGNTESPLIIILSLSTCITALLTVIVTVVRNTKIQSHTGERERPGHYGQQSMTSLSTWASNGNENQVCSQLGVLELPNVAEFLHKLKGTGSGTLQIHTELSKYTC